MGTNIVGKGGPTPGLHCSFTSAVCDPPTIKLPIGIGGISWTYTLHHKVEDTYGGQVIQILGVSIDNLKIRGNFAYQDPFWGSENGVPRYGSLHWDQSDRVDANGIRQMADWFRQYFEATTQGRFGMQSKSNQRYSEKIMLFEFPARGWKIRMRPTNFPSVVVDNETPDPEWTVEADFVEDAEDNQSFVQNVTEEAYGQISQLKEGVGFERNNPFSGWVSAGPTVGNVETIDGENAIGVLPPDEAIKKLLDSWEDSIWNNYSEEEIADIVAMGYSYPANALKAAGFKPSDFFGGGEEASEVADPISNVTRELGKWFAMNAALFAGGEDG